MTNSLPKAMRDKVVKAVLKKVNEFGYPQCNRRQSNRFMNDLIKDPEVGQVLKNYMENDAIKTYIKDGILNAYAKRINKKALSVSTPEQTIMDVYHKTASVIYKGKGKLERLSVLRSESGAIYIVSGGTVLKWETALRKALDIIVNYPRFTIDGTIPSICLQLSIGKGAITEADKNHIRKAIGVFGVKAVFCAT